MNKNEYSLRLNEILRGDEVIAEYDRDTGEISYLEGMKKYRSPVVIFLRKNGMKETKIVSEGGLQKTQTSADALAEARKLLQDAGQLPADDGKAPVNASTGKPSLLDYVSAGQPLPQDRTMDAPVNADKSKTYPNEPPRGPDGDKDPVYVEWLYANHPIDADKRYRNRTTHLI